MAKGKQEDLGEEFFQGVVWMSSNMSPAEHVHALHLDEFSVTDGRRLDFGPLPGTPPHPTSVSLFHCLSIPQFVREGSWNAYLPGINASTPLRVRRVEGLGPWLVCTGAREIDTRVASKAHTIKLV